MSPKLRPFALTWRSAIALSGLPRTTRAVAWALANYMNERGESAYPSVITLCGDVGNEKGDGPAHKRTVIDALRQLEDEGWLVKAVDAPERNLGGRGRTTEWHARIPERVQQLHRIEPREDDPSQVVRHAVSRSLNGSDEAPGADPAEPQRVQLLHSLPEGERVHSQHERVQSRAVKGAATAPEVEEVDEVTATAGAGSAESVNAAAAGLLNEHLKRLGVGAALRRQALADPLRAKAWLDLAQTSAQTNVAGFFRTGLDSGLWPSPRIDREGPRAARMRWAHETSLKLELDDAHAVVEEWPDLDDVDRQEMREWLVEARARADAQQDADAA